MLEQNFPDYNEKMDYNKKHSTDLSLRRTSEVKVSGTIELIKAHKTLKGI